MTALPGAAAAITIDNTREVVPGSRLVVNIDNLATALAGNLPAHATTHQNGGSDQISVAGLTGLLATAQTPVAHAATHSYGNTDTINVENLATANMNVGYVLRSDGDGTLSFVAPGGGSGAVTYDVTYTHSLISTNATAGADYSINLGYGASNTAAHTISIGEGTVAASIYDVIVGYGAYSGNTPGGYNVIVGWFAQAKTNSVALGKQANSLSGASGVAVGTLSQVAGDYGVSVGTASNSTTNAIAVGHSANASAANSVAIGQNVANSTTNSIKMGWANTANNYIHFTSFTPAVDATAPTHSIPITIGGATFHICIHS